MNQTAFRPSETAPAPQGFRDALAELVGIGMRVARMVGQVADAETALAEAAAQTGVEEGVSALASSLAEAIEADRAAAAAAETRHTVVARTEAVAEAFARVSRAVRLTVMLAERLDRGWARGGAADDRPAIARPQMSREAVDATEREAEGERAQRLTGAFAERLEALDTEAGIGDRSAEAIIGEICRDLGLDPARMTVRLPVKGVVSLGEAGRLAEAAGFGEASKAAPLTGRGRGWAVHPPRRHPDG